MYGFLADYWRKTNQPNKPVVLLGNKTDSNDRKVHYNRVTLHRKPNTRDHMIYFEMSVLQGTNLMTPFLWLAQNLYQDHHLALTYVPVRPEQPEANDEAMDED
jgi:hypothetical protein